MSQKVVNGLKEGSELLIEMIRELVTSEIPGSVLVVISGGTCSGKSLLALTLEEILKKSGIGVSNLGLDHYYKNADHPQFPRDSSGRLIFDLPDSYLTKEFRKHVKSLVSGFNVESPIFDKKTNKRAVNRRRLVKSQKVIITEGLFAIKILSRLKHPKIVTVFVDADTNIRIDRRLKRDTGWLHPTAQETRRFIDERVEPYYENQVKPQLKQADLVVINN